LVTGKNLPKSAIYVNYGLPHLESLRLLLYLISLSMTTIIP